jgi:predicted nucleic acid-binding protein
VATTVPDTSVLVAAFCSWHEHHDGAARAVEALLRRPSRVVVAAHVLFETYSVLTRLPPPHRLSASATASLLRANLADVRVVTLDGKQSWDLVDDLGRRGVAGGRSYDALIVACAVRAGADRVLTLNRRDFEALVPDGVVVDCPLDGD